MKVLGISFGRVNQRSDFMVKEALFAAKAAGADVEFINTIRLDIGHCRACDYCSRSRGGDSPEIHCILRDDLHILEEAVLNADGIIIGAPVYAVGITGQLKNFIDRFCCSHDRPALIEANKQRVAAGKAPLDPRYFKDRYVGYISVGGAQTRNWVAFGLPIMHLFDFSMNMKTVGHIDAYDQGRTGNPILDRELMGKCSELGRAVAESIGKPYDQVDRWVGEQDGVCPVCHCRLLNFNGTTDVECPICGIWGKMKIEGDKVSVDWTAEQIARARGTITGLYEHYNEIRGMMSVCIPKLVDSKNREFIAKETEKYVNFDKVIAEM